MTILKKIPPVLLSPKIFGVLATYTDGAITPESCYVMINQGLQQIDSSFSARVAEPMITIEVWRDKISVEPSPGDIITIVDSGIAYRVKKIIADDGDLVKMAVLKA